MNTSLSKNQTGGITVIPPDAGESWWIVTDHQHMKLTAANTGGAVSLWFETVPPGGGPPPHIHYAEDEVFVVMDGEITFQSGERSWIVQKGAVVFAPRGLPHTFRNSGETPARLVVFVTPGGFDGYFRETAFRWENPEMRPPIEQVEIDRLFQSAPSYDLEFCVAPPADQDASKHRISN